MHDVRNQVYSITQSIEHFMEFEDINGIKSQSKSNSKPSKDYTQKDSSNQIQNKNESNSNSLKHKFSDSSKNSKYDALSNIQKQKEKIDDKVLKHQQEILKKESILENEKIQFPMKFPKNINQNLKNRFAKLQKVSKTQVLDLDLSFDNESVINENIEDIEINLNDDKNESCNQNQTSNKKFDKFNSEIQRIISYSKNINELLDIMRFINQKISFLQHLDLTFEQIQKIKYTKVDPTDILNQLTKILKILFLNKQSELVLEINSNVEKIKIDIHMLKYLTCQICLQLHERNNRKLDININFNQDPNQIDVQQITFTAQLNSLSKNTKMLNDSQIFKNIITNIGYNVNQTQNQIENIFKHEIILTYNKNDPKNLGNKKLEKNLLIDIDNLDQQQKFYEKVSIKDDKVVHINKDEHLIIIEERILAKHNGYIQFINIDDEINIKSMHTLLFSKKEIALNCCSTQDEFIGVLMQIYSEMSWKVGQHDKVVCLLDHLLDGFTGLDLLVEAKQTQNRFNLEITWVLVSSTEDEDTIQKYINEGIQQFIEKPLTSMKIDKLIKEINQEIN